MRSATAFVLVLLVLAPQIANAKPKSGRAHAAKVRPANEKKTMAHGDVRPRKSAEVRFLGQDPHGPLAVARKGAVETPKSNACRTWAPMDSLWMSLDKLGQVVGQARVTGLDRYDVTNCDELYLETARGKEGAGIFVKGAYTPLALMPWKPTQKVQKSLQRHIAMVRDPKLPKASEKGRDLPLVKRALMFETPSGQQYAIVGGRGISILRWTGERWQSELEHAPKKNEVAFPDMFLPIAVLDMNGDGAFEVVVHERYIDAYDDITWTRRNGKWISIEAGIHGAFA